MRVIGCVLMISGWLLMLATLVLLDSTGKRVGFITAALLVEFGGLGLIAQHYRGLLRGPDQDRLDQRGAR